ncbi:SDR family oxidoreductase [Streptomyces lydicus]
MTPTPPGTPDIPVTPGTHPGRGLTDQTVVVIGASAGIGLETARQVRAGGGQVVLVGRNPDRLAHAARELDPLSTAAFDATDTDRLQQFFHELPGPVDHVMVTAGGPSYVPLADLDLDAAGREIAQRIATTLGVAVHSRDKVRAGGTLLFMGGTGGRRPAAGKAVVSALTAALPALIANLALELAPIRVNLIAAGFVDTPLSAALLGDQVEARREELRATLPIRRVVGPSDVAALAVHLMCNDALTGGTYDIDGGQQLLPH